MSFESRAAPGAARPITASLTAPYATTPHGAPPQQQQQQQSRRQSAAVTRGPPPFATHESVFVPAVDSAAQYGVQTRPSQADHMQQQQQQQQQGAAPSVTLHHPYAAMDGKVLNAYTLNIHALSSSYTRSILGLISTTSSLSACRHLKRSAILQRTVTSRVSLPPLNRW